MTNELKKLIKDIQYRTDKTLADIAKEIGYSTAYFTDQVNKGKNDEIKERLLLKYPNKSEGNVPREIPESLFVEEKAEAYDKSFAEVIPDYSKRYIALLEEIAIERKQGAKGLESRLNEMIKTQKEILQKLELMFSTLSESSIRPSGISEIQVVREYKGKKGAKGKKSRTGPLKK
jgi:seryl-tRNA synthetase